MAERKATNKYIPPDFDPSKHGSVNGYRKSHHLRERARKINQGILIIRFEMPYNIWCEGCNNHIGMGVRYNAEKSKTGNYYTTPIYKFRMKCHLCDNHFEIQTDPKNHDYEILNGARRQENRWDPEENEQIVTEDRDTIKRKMTDAMFKLEHEKEEKQKSKSLLPVIGELESLQHRWKDDFGANRMLRNKLRASKKLDKLKQESEKAITSRSGLNIKLLDETLEDRRMASLMQFNNVQSSEEKQAMIRGELITESIFSASKIEATTSSKSNHLQNLAKIVTSKKIEESSTSHERGLMGVNVVKKNEATCVSSVNLVPYGSDSD